MMDCWMHHQTDCDTTWTTATATGINVTVGVEQGTLRGQEKVSIFFPDIKYYSFEGIPYAKPPIGPLRFKDPEEPEPWPGVRDAIGKGPTEPGARVFSCVDWLYLSACKRTDDCLYLDVDTPQIDESGKPVIVWIHPICFSGEAGLGPQIFGVGHYMAEDVVVVTVRYRYSVLGFLCLDHEEVPGNAGLKDQLMALRWVQRNISKFGGDPNNVTLYGFGIAAAFVHYHLMSPLSEGLFHRVIIQGDCTLNLHSYITRENATKKAFRVSHMHGQETGNAGDLLEFLRALPVTDLLLGAAQAYYPGEDMFYNGWSFESQFVPYVEVPATNKSFLPLSPRELLEQGRFAKVPTLFGVTNYEGSYYSRCCRSDSPIFKPHVYKKSECLSDLAKVVGYTVDGEESGEWAEEIKNFYFQHNSTAKEIENICKQMVYDYSYYIGFDDAARIQLEHTGEPVYAFEFMLYNIKNPLYKLCKRCTPREQNTVYNWLIKMWTSFAKTGNPNNETMKVTWEPARKDSFCYLKIDNNLSFVRGRIAEDRMKMWQQLFDRYPKIHERYSQIYIRRVRSETEKYYMEPELQLLFGNDD